MVILRWEGPITGGLSAAASTAWMAHWPDEGVPALGGLSPRRAARSEPHQPQLEALLRSFEHDADRHARAGQPAMDINVLRDELAMPVQQF